MSSPGPDATHSSLASHEGPGISQGFPDFWHRGPLMLGVTSPKLDEANAATKRPCTKTKRYVSFTYKSFRENSNRLRKSGLASTDTHFAYKTLGVHLLLKQHRCVSDVVRRNEPVGVVHAGRMHRVPVNHTQRRTGLALKLQLYHSLVDVMFVSTSPDSKTKQARYYRYYYYTKYTYIVHIRIIL